MKKKYFGIEDLRILILIVFCYKGVIGIKLCSDFSFWLVGWFLYVLEVVVLDLFKFYIYLMENSFKFDLW